MTNLLISTFLDVPVLYAMFALYFAAVFSFDFAVEGCKFCL